MASESRRLETPGACGASGLNGPVRRIRAVLRCPKCTAPLADSQASLTCTVCDESYSVRAGIPLLRFPRPPGIDAHVAGGGWGSHSLLRSAASITPQLLPFARAIYPPSPAINVVPTAEYKRIAQAVFQGIVLNIGSGSVRGLGRRLWNHVPDDATVIHVDLAPFAAVAMVADAANLPIDDASVDGVILQAVLEHVADPWQVLNEARRVLKPGGHLYVEVPFLQSFHADPDDFQRSTLPGLRTWLRGFDAISSGVSSGPVSTVCWLVREAVLLLVPTAPMRLTAKFAISWLLAPFRYLDWLAVRHHHAHCLACEVYMLARKR